MFFLLLALTITGATQAQKVVKDENAEVRKLKGFHSIKVSGGIDLYLSQTGQEEVAVSASSVMYRNKITTEVVDGVLHIGYDKESAGLGISFSNKKLKAYVSVKTLGSLSAAGGSDVEIDGVLKATELSIAISGGSDLDGTIQCDRLKLTATGGSDAVVKGTATKAYISASGGSDVEAFELLTDDSEVHATGGSDVNITANKNIDASASGGSDVRYKGNAKATANTISKRSGVKKVG